MTEYKADEPTPEEQAAAARAILKKTAEFNKKIGPALISDDKARALLAETGAPDITTLSTWAQIGISNNWTWDVTIGEMKKAIEEDRKKAAGGS